MRGLLVQLASAAGDGSRLSGPRARRAGAQRGQRQRWSEPGWLPGAPPPPPGLSVRLRAALAPDRGPPGRTYRGTRHFVGKAPKYTNRLILETSPYLLQHAHNPVDWHPWGDEAFAEARERGVPLFVSIGYSTCHWCHVMEVESFEDEEIARYMNGHYVCVKVDREERPDVDAVYMSAVEALDRVRRMADERLADARSRAVFRRNVFPAARRRPRGRPGVPDAAASTERDVPEGPGAHRATGGGADLSGAARPRGRRGGDGGGVVSHVRRAPGRRRDRGGGGVFRRSFDDQNGGLRGAPKFPSSLSRSPPSARPPPHRGPGRAADGHIHPREDGRRRHLRSDRRRLSPLRHRRRLAGAALREDALRQRAPRGRLPRGLSGHRARRLRAGRARDPRLPPRRDDVARRRFLFSDGRRLRRRGREVLRLVGRRAPRRCWAPAPTDLPATTASPPAATFRDATSSTSRTPTRPNGRRSRAREAALRGPRAQGRPRP